MGVPGFLKWLKNRKGKIIVNSISTTQFGQILIDLNSFIHQAAEKVYGYGTGQGISNPSHQKIIDEVMVNIDAIIDGYYSKEYVIAIDGVPTLSKISQQKKRRFNSVEIGDWSNIFISPFHEFMDNLYTQIYERYAPVNYARRILGDDGTIIKPSFKITKSLDKLDLSTSQKKYLLDNFRNVKISSHLEPGEGEHKLMKMFNTEAEGPILFFGTDADIIILSFAKINTDVYVKYKNRYISKRGLLENIKEEGINQNDFILITYLCGNDFILPLEDFKNIIFSLDRMLKIYSKLKSPIIEYGKIKWDQLKEFFYLLLQQSDQFFIHRMDADELPSIIDGKFSKKIHQKYLDLSTSRGDFLAPISTDMCFNWVTGLQWFINSYNGKLNNDWYYQFNYPLQLQEIVDFMEGYFHVDLEKKIAIIEEVANKNIYRLNRLQHFVTICPYKHLKLIKDVDLSRLVDLYPIHMEKDQVATLPLTEIIKI